MTSTSPSMTSEGDQHTKVETQVDMEKSASGITETPRGPPPVPEGGTKAWLVVFGAMIVNACSFGYASSFGVYQTYYQTHQLSDKTPSDIAWIGSLQFAFLFGSGLLAGSLFDRYGARPIIVPAAVSYIFSIMMTSLCKEYYQFILAQGILSGISIGFLFTPSLSVVNHYFRAKKGAALGLVAVGSTIGGTIIPIVLQKAFESHLGFGWGVRVLGFGELAVLCIACALIKERLPPRVGPFFAWEAFRDPSYSLLVAGIFCLLWGLFLPFFYVADYAIAETHMSNSLAFYLISVINGSSLVGRVASGAAADKLGWLNGLTVAVAMNAVVLFCWTTTSTNAGLIIWTVIFGLTSGSAISLFPASLASVCPNPQLIGTYVGQSMVVFFLAGLTGAPIAGAILNKSGFPAASYFAGVSVLVGAVCIAGARFYKSPHLSAKV